MSPTVLCPTCKHALDQEMETCPSCGQAFCPECSAAIAEDANSCQSCGAEFALFCSACEQEISLDDLVCPHCLASLEEPEAKTATAKEEIDLDLPPRFSGECPSCATPLFLEDGFCNQCGTTFCTTCGKEVDEEDEVCPHCRTPLFFNCPLCDFELTSGTDQCPNCNALIPSYCTNCKVPLQAGAENCSRCTAPILVTRRKTARVIHSFIVGEKVVQVAACPGCGQQLHISDGNCSSCDYRFCPQCQISLEKNEEICPRCGPHRTQYVQTQQQSLACPNCGSPLQPLDEQCPDCGQLFCPECQAAISEDDTICPQCRAEFEYACPQCDASITADADTCPQCGFEF